jgi:hypothetical protein
MDMGPSESQAGSRKGPKNKRPKKLSYGGHDVTVLDLGEPEMPMLSIDGKDIMVRREETGGYSAPMLNMFGSSPTLEDLARSLIETSPVFLAQRKTSRARKK